MLHQVTSKNLMLACDKQTCSGFSFSSDVCPQVYWIEVCLLNIATGNKYLHCWGQHQCMS